MGNGQGHAAPPPVRPHNRQHRYTLEDKNRAYVLIDQGHLSYRAIAARIHPHCSAGTICRWRKERRQARERERTMRAFEANELERERAAAERRRARGW